MVAQRAKRLKYIAIVYLIFLGTVAAYRYTELHEVYASDYQNQLTQISVGSVHNAAPITSVDFLAQQINIAQMGSPVDQPLSPNLTYSDARKINGQQNQPISSVSQPKFEAKAEPKVVPTISSGHAQVTLLSSHINTANADVSVERPVPKAPSNLTGENNKQPIQMTKDIGSASVGIGEYYDTTLGSITQIIGSGYLGNESNAGAIEIDAGPRIARLNLTYGVAFTDKQRVKFSAERLDERLDYGFDTGSVRTWEGQSAIGASYDYGLYNRYIQSIGISGYFTHSGSKDLPDAVDGLLTEERRIAGANSGNVHFDVAGQLWPYSRLSGGADYDAVHFNTRYNSADQDVHGFGGHVKVEQRLLPSVKFTMQGHWQQVDEEYLGVISWLIPSPRGVQFELEGTTDYYDSLATHRHFYTNGARLNVHFDGVDEKNKGVYSDLSQTSSRESLLSWTRTPAVRMTEVLAIADSALRTTTGVVTIACPPASDITCTGSGIGSVCTVPSGWTVVPPTVGNAGDAISFEQAFFDTQSSTNRGCSYQRGDISSNIIMITNTDLGAPASPNWNTSQSLNVCNQSESACLFADNRFTP